MSARSRLFLKLLAALLLAVLVFFMGPVNEFGPLTPASRAAAPQQLHALDNWLADTEAKFPELKPGTAKGIVWAQTDHHRTEWAVVYVHGFSASRMETAPVADEVAQSLGANLFYTRLSGHGLPGEAMGQATPQAWLADTVEAVRIGKLLGKKVLLISCSTGATLATWLGTSADAAQVDAHVFISPNFGLKDKRAELINGHWGQQIALAVKGAQIQYTSDDPREAQAWTQSYPTQAIFPMMYLVQQVRNSDLSAFKTPVLVVYSEQDQTIEPQQVQAAFARFGSSEKQLEAVTYSQSKGQHVLAGSIRDPQAVSPMVSSILKWLNSQKSS